LLHSILHKCCYLNQGESPAVYGGRESDTPRHKLDERKLIVTKKQLRDITYIVKKKENNKDLTLKDNKKYELRLFLDDLMRKLV
jgi:hypothetical protein